MRGKLRAAVMAAAVLGLAGCAGGTGVEMPVKNAPLVQGPPVQNIVTPFDEALMCLNGQISKNFTFAVGAVLDQTGKEQLTDGGAGRFITQGAGDIIQSALFKAGTGLVNRRDPRVIVNELQWGLRDASTLIPAHFHITGSINSLDFIPGSGFDVTISGIGPRYRQHRILVGLDLAVTETATGRIVANVPLQKQVFAEEFGLGVGRFFGDTLVSLDVGGQNREALHFALREMLNLATFELLTQMMPRETWAECEAQLAEVQGHERQTAVTETIPISPRDPTSSTPGTESSSRAAAPQDTGAQDSSGSRSPDGNEPWYDELQDDDLDQEEAEDSEPRQLSPVNGHRREVDVRLL
ncbi:MAG TPA: CsgG/HfaB family protein [Kiloniellales bacterium]|jgi:curli biogenesis system outer membrane secretion channel CsgG|nr:CsgG/HfaB family protein [Kiloniellales bacterium]